MADVNLDQIEIIKGSSVLEITNPENTYMLGYKTINGIPTTVRIDFSQMTPLFGLSQEINDSTTTSPSNKAVKTALAGKADKKNTSGHLVVYTPDGKAVTHAELTKALEGKADGLYVDPKTNQLFLKSGEKTLGTGITLPENGSGGLPNISKENDKYNYASKQEARAALPEKERYKGIVITYQLATGEWVLDMFIGDALGSWSNEGSWRSFVMSSDLESVLTALEEIKNTIQVIDNRTQKIPDGFDLDEDNNLYQSANGERIGDPIQLPSGGGGTGSGIIMRVRVVGLSSLTVGEDTDVAITYSFTSVEQDTGNATGPGTYILNVNGANVDSGQANQGENTLNLKGLIHQGSNVVKVRVVDGEGNAKTVTWNIQVATLKLTSTFDDGIYNNSPVLFRYTPVGIGTKTIRFFLDDKELPSETTETSGRQMTKELSGLSNGSHSLRVFAESTIAGSTLKSNELYYEFIFADATMKETVIAVSYNKEEVPQFSTIDIPFLVYNPSAQTANITIRANGQIVSQMDVPRTKQHFTYPANTEGKLIITFTSGTVSKVVEVDIIASGLDISEEKADLEYKVSAVGKTNSSIDRDKWDYNNYTAEFENFSFSDDGWQKDENGENCLKFIGDSKVKLNINPFQNNILVTGSTLTFKYATSNVTDQNAVVISSMFNGVGLEMTPTSVTMKSAQSVLTARFDSSKPIEISVVVEKLTENKVLYLFVDGISSGSLEYPATDNFTQATPQPFVINTGERACQLSLYGVRWYKNSLNFEQILGNYIFDIENVEDKISVYLRNQITDEYGNIDYNKALKFISCMTIIGDAPNYKGDKKIVDIIYENLQNPSLSFTAERAEDDVQGTSSQFYPRKNDKIKFKNGIVYTESGLPADKYSLRGTGIPSGVFCLKADFAESSGTHNTGLAIIIDTLLRQMGIFVPPQLDDERVRTTIDGEPILLFRKKTATSPAEFIGKYNFNYDKGSEEVFGFKPGDECWEFLNNTSPICLFKSADFTSTITDDKGNVIPAWLSDLEGRYPDGNTDNTKIVRIWNWVLSCIGNPSKFKAECANYFDVRNLLSYELWTEFFAASDQKAKNMMMAIYAKDGKARMIFYDNDTILGINNEGRIAFLPYIEPEDVIESGHVFNGWDSELWRLVREAYPNELRSMYQEMRQQQYLTLTSVLKVFQNQQADRWCELVYNHDGKFKYIDPLVEGYWDYSEDKENPKFITTGAYLYALQGSRSRHRTWWLTDRFSYLDSKYNAGGHITDHATFRLYTPETWQGVTPSPNFEIKTAKDGYFRIKYGSHMTEGTRGFAGQSYTVKPPISDIQFNDTETIIYGISTIKSLGDLSNKYAGTVDVSRAYALEDLILGSISNGYINENLSDLHTGNNERLKKINVANSPNLKQSLDLSKCYSLEEIEARGSGLTGFTLPNSGVLKKAYLPASFAALVLKNQPYLESLTIEGYANLNTVIIDNVPGIDGYSFVKNCVNTVGSKLSKVRLINIDASDTTSTVLNALAQMTGEDENGLPTDLAVLTGKITINQITQGALDRYRTLWPNLKIIATSVLEVIDFADNIVKGIMVANFDSNGDGEVSPTEVENKVVTENLLSGVEAKIFNELHYWTGTGSIIRDVPTLESVSILSGHVKLENLPNLKKVDIYQSEDEVMTADPLINVSNTFTNCYNIDIINSRGRYVSNSKKGVLLGRVNGDITYYKWIMPLKGYSSIEIDEPLWLDGSSEASYSHSKLITSLVINKLRYLNTSRFLSLKKITIKGLSDSVQNDMYINNRTTPRILEEIYIDGSINPGMLRNITFSGDAAINLLPKKVTIGPGVYGGGGVITCANSYTKGEDMVLELGIDYYTTIKCIRGGSGNNSGSYINTVVIRNTNPDQMTQVDFGNYSFKDIHFGEIYVPDELLDIYKNATNWNLIAHRIKALSLWDNV